MHKPAAEAYCGFGEVGGAGDIGALSHSGIEFARFKSAIACGVEDGAKTVAAKQAEHAVAVFGVERFDAEADELPRLRRPDADHLTGVALLEVRQRVEAGDAGNAGE